MASWRSGDAEDCKSLYPGSIPGEASKFPIHRNALSNSNLVESSRDFGSTGAKFVDLLPKVRLDVAVTC